MNLGQKWIFLGFLIDVFFDAIQTLFSDIDFNDGCKKYFENIYILVELQNFDIFFSFLGRKISISLGEKFNFWLKMESWPKSEIVGKK